MSLVIAEANKGTAMAREMTLLYLVKPRPQYGTISTPTFALQIAIKWMQRRGKGDELGRPPHQGLAAQQRKQKLQKKESFLGHVWNAGIENTGIEKNTGIGYGCIGKTEKKKVETVVWNKRTRNI